LVRKKGIEIRSFTGGCMVSPRGHFTLSILGKIPCFKKMGYMVFAVKVLEPPHHHPDPSVWERQQ